MSLSPLIAIPFRCRSQKSEKVPCTCVHGMTSAATTFAVMRRCSPSGQFKRHALCLWSVVEGGLCSHLVRHHLEVLPVLTSLSHWVGQASVWRSYPLSNG